MGEESIEQETGLFETAVNHPNLKFFLAIAVLGS